MEHISATLQTIAEKTSLELTVSKRRMKRLDAIELVRQAREDGTQSIGTTSRPFTLCGLPIKRPPKGTLVYIRRNGRYILRLSADAEYGLPFGQDRLIPIWIATMASVQKTPIIEFDSAAEILDLFKLPKDGRKYKRLVEGFKRIFTTTIYFGTEDQLAAGALEDMERVHYFNRLRLWYNHDVNERSLPGVRNRIVLSDWFWNELRQHPIPVDLDVVRDLADSSGALDFYLWLCWRCWTTTGQERIPLFGTFGLLAQLGVEGYAQRWKFRQTLRAWIKATKDRWPSCPADLSSDGNSLILRPAKAIQS